MYEHVVGVPFGCRPSAAVLPAGIKEQSQSATGLGGLRTYDDGVELWIEHDAVTH
jgi:hypothetical protein